MKKCILELKGGLGNQLFQIQAGVYFDELHKLHIDLRVLADSHRHSRSTFESFELNSLKLAQAAIKLTKTQKTLNSKSLIGIMQYLSRSADIKSSSLNNVKVLNEPQSPSLFDPINVKGNEVILNGYYQSAKLREDAENLGVGLSPKLRTESGWFKELKAYIEKNDPVVLHVRRGDYIKSKEWGILGVEYYEEAFSLATTSKYHPLLVFSDEPAKVRSEFENSKILRRARVVFPPNDSSAAESLILISLAKRIVIGNSTFSLWGALLAENPFVVAPSNFYRISDGNSERYKKDWCLIQPHWSDQWV